MPREDMMSAPVKIAKTPAEVSFREQFKSFKAAGSGGPELARMRREAFDQFERSGLPSRRVEAWHYTDLRARLDEAAPRAQPPSRAFLDRLVRDEPPNKVGRLAPRLFFVDGHYVAGISDTALLPAGVSVRTLAEMAEGDRARFEQWFAGNDLASTDPVVALNTAFLHDCLVLDIVAGTNVTVPVHVTSIISDGAGHATYPRLIVRLGDDARLTLVETQCGKRAGQHQRNAVSILHVGDRANLEHVTELSDENSEAINLCSLIATLGANAAFNSFALISAGALVRRQIFLRFSGRHARANLRGVALLAQSTHADTTLVVEHEASHCQSRELFKHIVTDTATGVFQGKVIVQRGAQKTDGVMKSQTLMLSQTASMNNKPELEIFADDVVCGHGATVGQLDRQQLFYLMARGLPRIEAEALLLEAFAAEATEGIADEQLRQALDSTIGLWLKGRAA
jgi:Fe-S cluster assembly protein SufD